MFDDKKFAEKLVLSLKKRMEDGQEVDTSLAFDEICEMSKHVGMLEQFYELIKSKKKGDKNEVNSYLAYIFGITSKKPEEKFKPKLDFELARISHLDVDIDFDFFHRNEVYDYLIDKYGREYTGNIGTYQRFKAKNALRKAIKALDPFDDKDKSLEFENYVAELIPNAPTVTLDSAIGENMELKKLEAKYKEVFDVAKILEGLTCASSRHAAGLVVSDIKIQEVAPLHRLKDGSYATQFEMAELEDLGLIKFDILALKTLSYFSMAEKDLKNDLDIDFDVDKIPLDDAKALKLIASGLTDSVFQLEGRGMKELLQNMKVNTFFDVAASNALYRPGAMAADAHNKYCDCKHGRAEIVYEHPKLKDILKDTYGQIIYQEQCQLIVMELAGFTRKGADGVRKSIGKKRPELMIALKKKFIKGAFEHSGLDERNASQIFEKIENMGGYAFNKSSFLKEEILTARGIYTFEDLVDIKNNGGELPKIYSPDGHNLVKADIVNIFSHGKLPIFQITLNNGEYHYCTMNHKFETNCGIYTLRDIIINNYKIKKAKNKYGLRRTRKLLSTERDQKQLQIKSSGIELDQTAWEFCSSAMPGMWRDIPVEEVISNTQETVCEMAKTQTGCTEEKFDEIFNEIYGGQKLSRKLEKKCFSVCQKINFGKSRRDTQKKKYDERSECETPRFFPKESFGNGVKNIEKREYFRIQDKQSEKMERRKYRRIQKKMCSKYVKSGNRIFFFGGKIFEGNIKRTGIQIFSENKMGKIFVENKIKTSGFYKLGRKDNSGIRRRSSFSPVGKKIFAGDPKNRFFIRRMGIGKQFSFNKVIGRHIQLQNKKNKSKIPFYSIGKYKNGRKEENNQNWSYVSIKSVGYCGQYQTYDLEISHPTHLFLLSDGTVNSNSHACAYGMLAMQCAYLKAHYPLYYMKAVLNTETLDGKLDSVDRYMKDCMTLKIKIFPCNVNKSKALFSVEDKGLRRGMASLKGVGLKAAEVIEKLAPFDNLENFVEKTMNESVINKKVVEVLMDNDAFSDFSLKDEEGLEEFLKIRKHLDYCQRRHIQKSSMFDLSSVSFS